MSLESINELFFDFDKILDFEKVYFMSGLNKVNLALDPTLNDGLLILKVS